MLVICQKFADASSLPGAANSGVLKKLIDSAGKVRLFSPDTFRVRANGTLYLLPQGGGRIDNAGTYSVLYLSDAAAGAVAEGWASHPK